MGRFVKLVLLFLSPIIIGMISIEILLRYIPNDYSFKRNYLDENSDDIEVLFLGNSHIYYGLNPVNMKYISFNAAHVAQSLNVDLAILQKYNSKWRNLKCLVVPVDYFSMYTSIESGAAKYRVKNYNIYYDLKIGESFWDEFELFNGKLVYHRLFNLVINHETDIYCNNLGFGTDYYSKGSKNLIESGKIAAKRHTVNNRSDVVFNRNREILRKLIAFSKQQHVKVLFVSCPAYKTYREHLNSNQLNTTIKYIKKLSSVNDNTQYVNLLSDASFLDTDFYDADHLNNIGAQKLSLKIDSIVNQMINVKK